MTRMTHITFFVLMLALAFAPIEAQRVRPHAVRGLMATPPSAELERFPIMGGVLTSQQVRDFHLREVVLTAPWTGLNWYRDKQRFVYETLPIGTKVLVDESGKVRYKQDCGNRLVDERDWFINCPLCTSLLHKGGSPDSLLAMADSINNFRQSSIRTGSATVVPLVVNERDQGFWSKLAENTKGLATGLWSGIAGAFLPLFWLLIFLLGLALVAGLIYALYRMIAGTRGSGGQNYTPPPAGPTGSRRLTLEPSPTPPSGGSAPGTVMDQPVVSPPEKRFLNFNQADRGQSNMLRFGGMKNVRYEQDGSTTTIRFDV